MKETVNQEMYNNLIQKYNNFFDGANDQNIFEKNIIFFINKIKNNEQVKKDSDVYIWINKTKENL
jgi:hypothetical protein